MALAAEGGMPQLDLSTFPGQIFWTGVTFFILYFFFGSHVLPALSRIVDGRADHVRRDLEESERQTAAAHEAKEAYERALSQARSEASGMILALEASLRDSASVAHRDFQAHVLKEIAVAERRIAKAQSDAFSDINRLMADCVVLSSEKLAGVRVDRVLAQAVIDSLSTPSKAA
ncbi:MAG: hypothetical protein H6862_05805 [Rhodospirillales bacterium]|nr:hypothetical protein [Rhodospirillales bacterium]